jgi:positive regulator of sigma E activity
LICSHVMFVVHYLLHLLVEKWFDIVLAFVGTLFGYWSAVAYSVRAAAMVDDRFA